MNQRLSASELNQLFLAARAGSKSALNSLLAALRGRIYQRARRFTAGMPQIIGPSSLTQEVSHALSKVITRVRGTHNATLFRLLDRLVQSRGVSAHRRETADKRDGGWRETWDDGANCAPEVVSDPHEHLEHAQRDHRLLIAIAQLPERQRIVVEGVLRGASASELTEQLQCSRAAVYNLLQRAKHSLEPSDLAASPACLSVALSAYQEQLSRGQQPDAGSIAAQHPGDEEAMTALISWLERLRRAWQREAG